MGMVWQRLKRVATLLTGPSSVNSASGIAGANRMLQVILGMQYESLVRNQKRRFGFDQVGFNVYSATCEDGILLYIFSLIGMETKRCVDIGAGGIEGSNVANLILNHYCAGLLIDGNPRNIWIARKYYRYHRAIESSPPILVTAMVTAENINDILRANGFVGVVDLLCIDIDGVDYWIWKAIDVIQPRVVVVEYQDILGPERTWTVPYSPDFNVRDYTVNKKNHNYCGASLGAFVKLGKEKGYRLVGCSQGGWNALFVRSGIGEEHLPEVSVESCFRFEWNFHGMETRFPMVKGMEWQEV